MVFAVKVGVDEALRATGLGSDFACGCRLISAVGEQPTCGRNESMFPRCAIPYATTFGFDPKLFAGKVALGSRNVTRPVQVSISTDHFTQSRNLSGMNLEGSAHLVVNALSWHC